MPQAFVSLIRTQKRENLSRGQRRHRLPEQWPRVDAVIGDADGTTMTKSPAATFPHSVGSVGKVGKSEGENQR